MYTINIYGWTNGHTCSTAALRTHQLILAALAELAGLPPLPYCIIGDINCNTNALPTLTRLFNDGWTDLGANAHWWHQPTDLPTCQAPNSKNQPTRRDYAIVCPALLPRVVDINIYWDEQFTVHAAVQVLLKLETSPTKMDRNIQPSNLSDAINKHNEAQAPKSEASNDDEKLKQTKDTTLSNIHE